MDDRNPQKLPLHERLLRLAGLARPPRVYLTHDGPQYLVDRISRQFEDELDTRKLKAIQL